MQRIVDHLAVIGAGHHSSRVRTIVDHMAPSVGTEHLEVVSKALVQLKREPVVVRAGGTLELQYADKRRVRPSAGELIVGKGPRLPDHRRRYQVLRPAQGDVERPLT